MNGGLSDFIEAANEVYRLAVLPAHPTPEEYIRASDIACSAFNRLYNSEDFAGVVSMMSHRVEETEAAFSEITRSLRHFKDFFVPRDIELLERHGVDRDLLRALADRAQELLVAVQKQRVDPDGIKSRLSMLRDDACALSSELIHKKAQQDSRRRLRRYAYALGGAVIIAVNGHPTALNYLSPAGTAVSAAWGGALIAPLIQP